MTAAVAEPAPAVALPHLSWSKVQAYLTCPRQFSYRSVERAPEERVSAPLVFGGAFHRAVERVHECRLAGEAPPTVEGLLAVFAAAWREEAGARPPIEYARGEDAGVLRDMAGRMLEAYLAHVRASPAGEVIAIEHEAEFALLPDAPPFKVRMDLLERTGDELAVSDFKTSRSRWNEDRAREHLPQVIAYSLAAAPLLAPLGIRRVVPRFVVITKAKAPKVQVVQPPASQEDVARLRNLVSEVWTGMRAGAFPARVGWQCRGCAHRDLCRRETACA